MNRSLVVGVLVFNDKNKILLCKKPDGVGPYPGMYISPGGGLNPDETAEDAARREVKEETGVTIKNITPIGFIEFFTPNWKGIPTHFISLMYKATYDHGDLVPGQEDDDHMQDIRWVSKKDAETLPICPPLKQILQSNWK